MNAKSIILITLVSCLYGLGFSHVEAATVLVTSAKGNKIEVSVSDTIEHPDEDDVLLAIKWPKEYQATVNPSPSSDWKFIETKPDPPKKQFDGTPGTTLNLDVDFETKGKNVITGEPDGVETVRATVKMPKIDLSILNPDGEEKGKDEFESTGGIVVMLPETSEEDPVYSEIKIPAIDPSSLGGNYQFTWSPDNIEIFEDTDENTAVEKDKDYDATQDWTFYVKGKKVSEEKDDFEFKVRWISDDEQTTIDDADKLNITVIKVELTLHGPGTKSEPGDVIERPKKSGEEEDLIDYTGILSANNDDDDERSTPEDPKRDNDDEDLGGDDNDIVKVTLDFQPVGLDEGTLEIKFNDQSIQAFTSDDELLKAEDFEIDLTDPQGKLKDLVDEPQDIFLEGFEGHIEAEDFSFTFKQKDIIKEDLAILLPVEVTWEKVDGDYPDLEDNINPFTDEVQGQRIFPGKKTPSDSRRNKAKLKVDVGIPNAQVYVKAFDVDDPTPKTFDTNDEVDSNDASTEGVGNDNRDDHLSTAQTGFFTSSSSATANKLSDANGIAEFEFNVGMQPGNNYRVVASVFNEDIYADVQVTDPSANGYLGPNEDDTPTPASPLLTVWRKLHVELDSMEQVATSGDEKNFETGFITDVSPSGSNYSIDLDVRLPGSNNRFQNGSIFIDGWKYDVVSSDHGALFGNDTIVVKDDSQEHLASALAANDLIGQEFIIFDDDDRRLPQTLKPALPQFSLIDYGVPEEFETSFIEVIIDTTHNTRTLLPFKLYSEDDDYFVSKKDITDNVDYWAHLVVAAYQPTEEKSVDPNQQSVLIGYTEGFLFGTARPRFSVIYVENIRDLLDPNLLVSEPVKENLLKSWFGGTAAHEIAHAPSQQSESEDHAESGLMKTGGDSTDNSFKGATVKRLRNAMRWSGGVE